MTTPVRRVLCRALSLLPTILPGGFSPAAAASPPPEPYGWGNVAIRGGGYVTGLAFHPREADLLYARTDVGGAFRWLPAQRRWLPLSDALDRANNELLGVLSLALDPHDPNRVYLACGSYFSDWSHPGAVLRSTDRGATWTGTDLPCKLGGNQDGRGTGERLQVDPHDGRILLLGSSRDGLWRSDNAARDWETVTGLPAAGVSLVLFDPTSGTDGRPTPVIYAALADLSRPPLYRSTDAGRTWAPVPGQPAGLLAHHAAIDARGTLYVAYGNGPGPNNVTDGAVWKFEPAAARWTDLTPVRPEAAKNDRFGYAGLALDPQHPGTMLVSTLDRWTQHDEIFRSTDGGATWTPLLARSRWNHQGAPYTKDFTPHWISDVAIDPFHPERAWFVTGYGVWATDQVNRPDPAAHPLTWVFPDLGLEETVVDALVSPPVGAPLLSAIGDLGGFRHDSLTVSPPTGAYQPMHGGSPSLDFAAQQPALLVRTHWGPARGALSCDGGATWTDFATTPPPAVQHGPGMAAISADGGRLVWLPKGAHPYYSADGGATWTESRTDFTSNTDWPTYGPVADRVNPGKFYLYDPLSGALLVSTDGGAEFVRTKTLPDHGGVLCSQPGAEGHLWLPTPQGLYVSTDAGRTFKTLPGVDEAHQVGFGAPAPGRTGPAVYLDGTVRGRHAYFRSDDGGATWLAISADPLRFGWIRSLTGDPRVFGRVYLGTSGRGIIVGEPLPPAP